ncbi:MAG: tRNA lysidine(34) synthetase TilS [Thermodesulfobacteriota bacterium]
MFFNQVKRTIDRYHLLEKGDRVIVGVSGGIDSMVLLHLLNIYRPAFALTVIVAHVNHGIRPAESEKEAELVQRESERLSLPFEYGQFDVKEFQKTRGISIQDAARKVRFHFFNSLLKKYGAQKIALGHNADDQVETVILRLMRGAGLKGLKGILPIREGRVIRPLLEVWRREIEFFATENAIPSLKDSSNLQENYLRNRLRLSLIPLIEREYQPNFKAVVMRASAFLREENDYLERGAEEAYKKIVHEEKDNLSFKFSEYQSLHQAIQWRVIQKMLGRIYSEEMIEEGLAIDPVYHKLSQASPSFLLELPQGVCLEKRYNRVLLGKKGMERIPPFEVEIISSGRTFIEEIGKEVVTEEIRRRDPFVDLQGSLNIAFFDYQNLHFPLKMRNFRPGDRFQPLGVKGTQKLKEFFIDHKIPRFERQGVPLLISGEMIAWVVGFRIDERVKVTEKTQRVLRVEVVEKRRSSTLIP